MPDSVFCPSCGAAYVGDARFCASCGRPRVDLAVPEGPPPPPSAPVNTAWPSPPVGSPPPVPVTTAWPPPPVGSPPLAGTQGMKSRPVAAFLALILGSLGIHKFYLGRVGLGVLYLLFFWTYIPGIVGWIEGILYLRMSDEQWARERNQPVVARGLHRDRVPVGLGDRTIDVGDLGNRGHRLADLPRRSGVDHPEQGRRVRVAVRRCDSDAKQSGRRTPKGARRPPLEWRPGSPMQGQESPDPTLGAGALLLR